jgi:hypothetical protein
MAPILMSSGTAALHLALLTLSIGNGDEVLVASLTNMATFFAVIYQSLRFLVFVVEDTMHPPGSSYSTLESVERGGYRSAEAVPLTNKEGVLSAEKYFWFRVLHSLLSAATYGLALILMLMAMSFNPSIFISLVAGYGLGDFIFFARMRPTSLDCH